VKRSVLFLLVILGAAVTPAARAEASPGRLAVLEDLRIDGPVQGDVVALGGNIELGPQARVQGNAVAVFGRVEAAGEARISGERISLSSLGGLKLDGAGSTVSPRLVWALRLLTWGFWLFIAGSLAAAFPSRTVRGVWTLNRMPAGALGLGIVAALTLLAALVAVFSAGPALGLPGAVALLLVFAAAKALGITLLGGMLGNAVLRRIARRRFHVAFESFLGVALLLSLRMVPVAGAAFWAVASVWSLGATVLALAVDPLRGVSGAPLTPED